MTLIIHMKIMRETWLQENSNMRVWRSSSTRRSWEKHGHKKKKHHPCSALHSRLLQSISHLLPRESQTKLAVSWRKKAGCELVAEAACKNGLSTKQMYLPSKCIVSFVYHFVWLRVVRLVCFTCVACIVCVSLIMFKYEVYQILYMKWCVVLLLHVCIIV